MAAQSYGFRAVWMRKCPAPSLLVFRLRRRSSKFLQAHHRLPQEAMMVNVRILFLSFEDLSSVWLFFFLPTFWRGAPALKFSWQLTRNVSLATILVHSYRRSLDEDERSLVGTSRSSFTAILRAVHVVIFFFHQATPSLVSSPSHLRRHSQAIALAFNQTKPLSPAYSLLDHRRHKSHQTYSSYQLLSHLETSITLFPAIWTKIAGSIDELFSQWTRPKRASSDQRTDEEDTSETYQRPRRWLGFDKCGETKLRLDVYIRPWPPGW